MLTCLPKSPVTCAGVIVDLRAQLQVSIHTSAQVARHTRDIQALTAQVNSRSTHGGELRRHSTVLKQLKTQLKSRAESQLEMTRQASILDDLKAQLSMSNDLSVDLMFSRTSLEEARALMAQALKSQPHHVAAAAKTLNHAQSSQHKVIHIDGNWLMLL